jgi:hypothetical protein
LQFFAKILCRRAASCMCFVQVQESTAKVDLNLQLVLRYSLWGKKHARKVVSIGSELRKELEARHELVPAVERYNRLPGRFELQNQL